MSEFRLSGKGSVKYVEALPLSRRPFLIHAFCTRDDGAAQGDFDSRGFRGGAAENAGRNWETIADSFRLESSRLITLNQVHGDGILVIGGPSGDNISCKRQPAGAQLRFDALVTDRRGIAIGVKTADCVPILLADIAGRVIGAVHAGWRGTALNIAGKVVDAFVRDFSSKEKNILAAIGPAIGRCCYQVDCPVYEALRGQAGRAGFSPCREKGRWMLDLPGTNRLQLEARGIPRENIFSGDYCTSCRGDIFFSYRREGANAGRHLNFIMLKGTGADISETAAD